MYPLRQRSIAPLTKRKKSQNENRNYWHWERKDVWIPGIQNSSGDLWFNLDGAGFNSPWKNVNKSWLLNVYCLEEIKSYLITEPLRYTRRNSCFGSGAEMGISTCQGPVYAEYFVDLHLYFYQASNHWGCNCSWWSNLLQVSMERPEKWRRKSQLE